ncbi:MAG TPA: type II toxin-antitoxin system HicB family antitoxin [Thermoanaerobaculia bacterium]|nr:type II toxin-antitoxin system HicB family antitoxin [Thermoanaerobaculia bacterium]
MPSYIALLRKDPSSDYGVEFPDFPGCVTAGADLEEARRFAEEALELHLAGLREDGEALPAPSDLEEIMSREENREAVAFLVAVPDPAAEIVRVDLELPETSLKEIDARASSHGLTRSEFLAQVTLEALRKSA